MTKRYSELYTTEEWIEYYHGASRRELKAALKDIRHRTTTANRNKINAIQALLA